MTLQNEKEQNCYCFKPVCIELQCDLLHSSISIYTSLSFLMSADIVLCVASARTD